MGLISIQEAQWYFGVSRRTIDTANIPVLSVGEFDTNDTSFGLRRYLMPKKEELVNFKEVRTLAIMHHGSREVMYTYVDKQKENRRRHQGISKYMYERLWVYTNGLPEFESGRLPPARQQEPYVSSAEKFSYACTYLPILRQDGTVETGSWCSGCYIAMQRSFGVQHTYVRRIFGEYGHADPLIEHFWNITRARSNSDFLDHAKTCQALHDLADRVAQGKRITF